MYVLVSIIFTNNYHNVTHSCATPTRIIGKEFGYWYLIVTENRFSFKNTHRDYKRKPIGRTVGFSDKTSNVVAGERTLKQNAKRVYDHILVGYLFRVECVSNNDVYILNVGLGAAPWKSIHKRPAHRWCSESGKKRETRSQLICAHQVENVNTVYPVLCCPDAVPAGYKTINIIDVDGVAGVKIKKYISRSTPFVNEQNKCKCRLCHVFIRFALQYGQTNVILHLTLAFIGGRKLAGSQVIINLFWFEINTKLMI